MVWDGLGNPFDLPYLQGVEWAEELEKMKQEKDVEGLIKVLLSLPYGKKSRTLSWKDGRPPESVPFKSQPAYLHKQKKRALAADALGEISDERAIEPLIKAHDDIEKRDTMDWGQTGVRDSARYALENSFGLEPDWDRLYGDGS